MPPKGSGKKSASKVKTAGSTPPAKSTGKKTAGKKKIMSPKKSPTPVKSPKKNLTPKKSLTPAKSPKKSMSPKKSLTPKKSPTPAKSAKKSLSPKKSMTPKAASPGVQKAIAKKGPKPWKAELEEAAKAKLLEQKQAQEAKLAEVTAKEKELEEKKKAEEAAKKAKKQELAPKQKPAGQTIPSLEVELVPKPEDVQTVLPNYRGATADLAELVKGKTVALIGVPAAFDKISEQQIPTFKKHRQQLADAGVEEIFVVAGNDAVVMRAWQTQIDALGQLNFLADPAGNVAKALKLADKDLSAQLCTPRSRRFALVVRDGLISFAAVAAEDPAPTFAERLLAAIDVDPEIIGVADA